MYVAGIKLPAIGCVALSRISTDNGDTTNKIYLTLLNKLNFKILTAEIGMLRPATCTNMKSVSESKKISFNIEI